MPGYMLPTLRLSQVREQKVALGVLVQSTSKYFKLSILLNYWALVQVRVSLSVVRAYFPTVVPGRKMPVTVLHLRMPSINSCHHYFK